jgi:uncharacterized protein
MEMIRRFEPVALLVLVLGALNWGMIGLFDTNVITEVFGTGTVTDVLYVVVGICGLLCLPKLMEGLRMGDHRAHPRGT